MADADVPAVEHLPPPPGSEQPAQDIIQEKPEILVGGALVGGFLFAKLLKKMTGA